MIKKLFGPRRFGYTQIRDGCKPPRFYGIAYHDLNCNQNVLYLIPVNIIVGLVRKIQAWFIMGVNNDAITQTFIDGFERGVKRGYERARRDAEAVPNWLGLTEESQ